MTLERESLSCNGDLKTQDTSGPDQGTSAKESCKHKMQQAQERASSATGSVTKGAKRPKPVTAQRIPSQSQDSIHGVAWFGICPTEFWSCTGPVFTIGGCSKYVEIRGQIMGVSSLLPCRSQGANSSSQV